MSVEALMAFQALPTQLEHIVSIAEAEYLCLAAVAGLAHASGALSFWQDDNGRLILGHIWAHSPEATRLLRTQILRLRLACSGSPDTWESSLIQALQPALAPIHYFSIRGLLYANLQVQNNFQAVLLLDLLSTPDDSLKTFNHAASIFLPFAQTLLQQHIRIHAMRAADRINSLEVESGEVQPEQVLQLTAQQLQEMTQAEAVLIYLGDHAQMRLVCCLPDHLDVLKELQIHKGTLARRALDQRRSIRISEWRDIPDEQRHMVDNDTQLRFRQAFEITELRSYLCVPVTYGTRPVGAIKLLSSQMGRNLGRVEQTVTETIAQRMAWEVQKISARAMIGELDQLTRKLSDTVGNELGPLLLQELSPWVGRFIRPNCLIAVISRTTTERTVLEVASSEITPELLDKLSHISQHLGSRANKWQKGASIKTNTDDYNNFPYAAIAAPILLPGQSELEGHFLILHAQSFAADQVAAAAHAARALSVILNAERIRQTVSLGAAWFRHALLGAVQGLTDAALLLAEVHPLSEEERSQASSQIEWEAENIRFWSATQRLMRFEAPGVFEIRPRPHPLKKLIETCITRYKRLMESRGIQLIMDWQPAGSLVFEFDVETLDLAISNLLHNALKYTYYNRDVTLGAQSSSEHVQIWVEDIGHPVPDRVSKEMYQQGRRFARDPLRAIPGEGLGLYMVRRVMDAHDGRVFHTCEPEKRQRSAKDTIPPPDAKTPYRVRFTLELPHHWRKRGNT